MRCGFHKFIQMFSVLQGILLAVMVAEFGSVMCPVLAGSARGMACVIDGLSTKWPAPICRWCHVCLYMYTYVLCVHMACWVQRLCHGASSCCSRVCGLMCKADPAGVSTWGAPECLLMACEDR